MARRADVGVWNRILWLLWWLLFATLVYRQAPLFLPDTGTLSVRDIDLDARPARYSLDNTSRVSGDVLGFVELPDGSTPCPHVFDMDDNTSVDVRFQCELAPGTDAVIRLDWVAAGGNEHLLESAERF